MLPALLECDGYLETSIEQECAKSERLLYAPWIE